MTRPDHRNPYELRPVHIELGYLKYAKGSCYIAAGGTRIICAASIANRVPGFLVGSEQGWLTAEYSLLPYSTKERTQREAHLGRLTGRTQEIQRLIGRALRAVCDLNLLPQRTIIIDCDVVQADGGTRVWSVVGGYCALAQATRQLISEGGLKDDPVMDYLAGVSLGILNGTIILDPCYEEDCRLDVDMNLVVDGGSRIIEVQASAERNPLKPEEFAAMLEMGQAAASSIIKLEKDVLR
jgi:ribonuclease PH